MPTPGDYGQVGDVERAANVVRAIYDAFAQRDLELALTYMHEEIVFVPAGTASLLGRSEPYVGHEGVRLYFADVGKVWDDLTLRVDDVRAAKEGVVVFGWAVGTTGGETSEQRAVWTWKIQNGLAVSMRVNRLGAAT